MQSPRFAYLGIGLISFALLASQVVLTRLFSVVLWYHFAFLVVSLVMLGMAAGGSLVYALPRWFAPARVLRQTAILAAASGLLLFAAVIVVLALPWDFGSFGGKGPVRALTSAAVLLPSFVGVGLVLAALFQAYPRRVPVLYFWDLVGAGAGAAGAVWLMWQLPGPSVGLLLGSLLIGSGASFALAGGHRRLCAGLALLCGLTLIASLANGALDLVRVRHTKVYSMADLGRRGELLHKRWSPIAYITVFNMSLKERAFVGWGVGSRFAGEPPHSYLMQQDAQAGTFVTLWDGDLETVSHLDFDVTALPYHVRNFDRVLIVGPGAGRDVLTALRGASEKVVAVDMNPDIIDLMTGELLEESGGLYARPEVEPVVAEARSWLTRTDRSFDLIQISLIDSWASTAAGAMTFAENNLYTVEAFQLYLEHLSEDGVLSISRWFRPVHRPGETLRAVSVAMEALDRMGVAEPTRHVMVARAKRVGTVLVSKRPFDDRDAGAALAAVDRYGLEAIHVPGHDDNHEQFAAMLTPGKLADFLASQSIDLTPVTDDRPFFFSMSRGLSGFRSENNSHHTRALKMLGWLIVGMAAASVVLVLGPLAVRPRRDGKAPARLRSYVKPLLYFAGLGAGFMLVELTLLQRFIVYLGHPTYAAAVVLTTLLVSLGAGSGLASRMDEIRSLARQRGFALTGIAVVAVVAFVGPRITEATLGAALLPRVAIAGAILVAVGVPLGTLLPLGMRRLVQEERAALVPWVWAVNGVAGVVSSAASLLIAITWGYTVCLLIGVGFYVLALSVIDASGTAVHG